jgi:predicted PurR-regulated permease PerM
VLAAGYYVMGLGHPLLLALLGAVAWLIPVVGFLFAAAAALLVGLVHSPILGILAAVFTVVIFIALQILVEEKWLKVRHDYSYLLVALLMIPLADTYGFLGLIAAPPLAVSFESLLEAIFDTRRQELTTAATETRLDELSRRLETLQAKMSGREDVVTPELSSLMARLEGLLTRTKTALEESKNPSAIAD